MPPLDPKAIPVTRLLDVRLVDAAGGAATLAIPADARLANPMGTVQGGILTALADVALGYAYASAAPGQAFTTLDVHTRFLRPAPTSGELTAKASVVRAGKTTALVECDITDDEGRLVARTSSTLLLLQA